MDFEGKPLLAPLSTFTNLPFRLLCQKYGAKGSIVPLISARALCMRKSPVLELDPDPSEFSVGVQIFGYTPKDIEEAAKIVAKKYDFVKYIDINCACPVKKVVSTGSGSALLKKPATVVKMIQSASKCGLPVTVKIRKSETLKKTLSFCKKCEKTGTAAIFIHGRSPEQFYSGDADWACIKYLAENISIPVIGSGDIKTISEGQEKLRISGCASFMIGRAAMKNPLVFSNVFSGGFNDKKAIFQDYLNICKKYDCVNFTDLKSKAVQFFTGFPNSVRIRGKAALSKTQEELVAAIENDF